MPVLTHGRTKHASGISALRKRTRYLWLFGLTADHYGVVGSYPRIHKGEPGQNGRPSFAFRSADVMRFTGGPHHIGGRLERSGRKSGPGTASATDRPGPIRGTCAQI